MRERSGLFASLAIGKQTECTESGRKQRQRRWQGCLAHAVGKVIRDARCKQRRCGRIRVAPKVGDAVSDFGERASRTIEATNSVPKIAARQQTFAETEATARIVHDEINRIKAGLKAGGYRRERCGFNKPILKCPRNSCPARGELHLPDQPKAVRNSRAGYCRAVQLDDTAVVKLQGRDIQRGVGVASWQSERQRFDVEIRMGGIARRTE